VKIVPTDFQLFRTAIALPKSKKIHFYGGEELICYWS